MVEKFGILYLLDGVDYDLPGTVGWNPDLGKHINDKSKCWDFQVNVSLEVKMKVKVKFNALVMVKVKIYMGHNKWPLLLHPYAPTNGVVGLKSFGFSC